MGMNNDDAKSFEEMVNEQENIKETPVPEDVIEEPVTEEPVTGEKLIKKNSNNHGL